MPDIAFISCAPLPDLDEDDRLAIEPLADLGLRVTPVVWDDPSVDWDRFHLSVLRSTWDYTDRRDAFVSWAEGVPRLHNPAAIVKWNTDKRYLADLAGAGLPVITTRWIRPGEVVDLPSTGEHVIKPSIGAGSMGANRYDLSDAPARDRAAQHADELLGAGHTVMIQPYAHAIEEADETSVILLDGVFSHAIRKGPMLGSDQTGSVDGLYKEERISARVATEAELDLARAVLAARPVQELTGGEPLLYGRVDMVPDERGRPMLMELELTEPSLFMFTAPKTAAAFARAIASRVRRAA